jgi:hypothetical protein
MSFLTGPLINGWAIIDVMVGVSRTRRSLLRKHNFDEPMPVHVRALLDTGASISGFSPRVFQQLDIAPVSKLEVMTPSTTSQNPHLCDIYDVSLSLVANGSLRPFPDVMVMEADCWLPNEGIEALLGMDILKRCHFQLWGPEGNFNLALQV